MRTLGERLEIWKCSGDGCRLLGASLTGLTTGCACAKRFGVSCHCLPCPFAISPPRNVWCNVFDHYLGDTKTLLGLACLH